MGDLFLLSERQMARISPFFPLSQGFRGWMCFCVVFDPTIGADG